jgi:hypothetical protein
MLLVATISLCATEPSGAAVPPRPRGPATRHVVATLARLARLHELVVVADWPDGSRPARSLVDALGEALPLHEIVLVAARADKRGRHPRGLRNIPTVRRLLEDGALVICLAGGPGRDRTEPVAAALAESLHADGVVRVGPGDAAGSPAWYERNLRIMPRPGRTAAHPSRDLALSRGTLSDISS